MRKLKRSIAHSRMERAGLRHVNKKRHSINPITGRSTTLPSFFAENWRKYTELKER